MMSLDQHMGRATLASSSRTTVHRDPSPTTAQEPAVGGNLVQAKYELVDRTRLGRGAFGKVELVRRVADGQLFARKQMYYPTEAHDPTHEQRERAETEIQIQQALTATGQNNITSVVDY